MAVSLLALAVLAAVAWLVVLPAVVRRQARLALAERWEGPVEVGNVELTTDAVTLRDIRLTDARGRQWMAIDAVRAYTRLNGGRMQIRAIRLSGGTIMAHVDADGRIRAPLLPPPDRPSPLGPELDLTVRDLTLALAGPGGTAARVASLNAGCIREPGRLRVRASNADVQAQLEIADGRARGLLTGTWDVTGQASAPAVALLSRRTGPVRALTGRVEAALHLEGRIDDPNGLAPRGEITWTAGRVTTGGGPLLEDVDAGLECFADGRWASRLTARCAGGELRAHGTGELGGFPRAAADVLAELTDPGAASPAGRAGPVPAVASDAAPAPSSAASLLRHFALPAEQMPSARAAIRWRDVDLVRLRPLMGWRPAGEPGEQMMSGQYVVTLPALVPADAEGQGTFALKRGQLYGLPVVGPLIDELSFLPVAKTSRTDVDAAYTTVGSVVTLRACEAANAMGAFELTNGSTIDIKTGQIDATVIYGPLRQVERFLEGLGGLLGGPDAAGPALSRVRMRGNIYRPKTIRLQRDVPQQD